MERRLLVVARDLGAELVDDGAVVGVERALDHHEGVGVGLAQQVLGLVDLVGGVHRHEHRADLDRRPEGDVPGGHVGRPDGDLAAGAHAHRDERPRERIHVVAELLVGARIVERRVLEAVLVGELLDHAVEHLREGQVDELVLLPHVLAGAVVVGIEALLLAARLLVAAHVVGVVRQDDARIVRALLPLGLPLERDEAVVVDRRQRLHHLGDGQRTLADDVVAAAVVGVAQVDVAHVRAEVGDRGVGILAMVAVRVVDLPERGEVVAREGVHEGAQAARIGVDARGADEDRHARRGGSRQQRADGRADALLVVAVDGCGDAGDLHGAGGLDEAEDDVGGIGIRQVARGVEARDAQAAVAQRARRGHRVVLVEGTAALDEVGALEEIVDLDALEVCVDRRLEQLVPGEVLPAAR